MRIEVHQRLGTLCLISLIGSSNKLLSAVVSCTLSETQSSYTPPAQPSCNKSFGLWAIFALVL